MFNVHVVQRDENEKKSEKKDRHNHNHHHQYKLHNIQLIITMFLNENVRFSKKGVVVKQM